MGLVDPLTVSESSWSLLHWFHFKFSGFILLLRDVERGMKHYNKEWCTCNKVEIILVILYIYVWIPIPKTFALILDFFHRTGLLAWIYENLKDVRLFYRLAFHMSIPLEIYHNPVKSETCRGVLIKNVNFDTLRIECQAVQWLSFQEYFSMMKNGKTNFWKWDSSSRFVYIGIEIMMSQL